jgi:hypothetical protein
VVSLLPQRTNSRLTCCYVGDRLRYDMQFDIFTMVPLLTTIGFVAVELLLLLSTGLDLLDTPPQLAARCRPWSEKANWMQGKL